MLQAITDNDLKKFIDDGNFVSENDMSKYVQPASIDLPLGSKAYLVKHNFLPFKKKIGYVVERVKIHELDLKEGAILYKGHTYLVKCGAIKVPKNNIAKISPKSSIGRIDLMVRALCDDSGLYDFIPEDTDGEVWLEITPQSFNVKAYMGIALSQLRLFEIKDGEEIFDEVFTFEMDGKTPVSKKTFDGKLILSLSVGSEGVIGYEALPTNNIIDLKSKDMVVEDFFKEIDLRKKSSIMLHKERFYILSTKELIRVPAAYCLEMVPFAHIVGELRAHYAGFFDPGFGGESGAVGVLEIRPYENLVVYDGQPICLMEVYKNKTLPEKVYGELGNNYQGQRGPRLAKYFKLN